LEGALRKKIHWRTRAAAVLTTALIAAGGGVMAPAPAWAAGCTTSTMGGTCGPYAYPQIPMSNGFNTYVQNQAVNPQAGTVNTLNVTDPGNWNAVASEADCGGCVQTFIAVQQLTNDWNGSGWGGATADTPLASLSSLLVNYSESSSNRAANYEFAPDVWNDNYSSDVMFWADTSPSRCTGNGLSSSDILGQATLDGQNWTVYRYGGTGSEIIIILDGTSSTDPVTTGTCAQQTSGQIDIKGGYQWLAGHGVMSVIGSLSQLNTGWEMCGGGTTVTVSSYSVTATVSGQAQAPAVVTSAATGVTTGDATLNGTVNPEGQAATYQYQFGTTTAYGTNVPASPASTGSGTSAVSEPQNVSGLSPGTTYHYRLTATNATGTANGADQTFTTPSAAQAPAVVTNAASGVTSGAATLNGTVNPNGLAATYQYQFGTSTSYGTNVPASPASAGSGTAAVSEPQSVTGLQPSTTYHYRLTAANASGTANGADQVFTTPAATSLLLGDSAVEANADSNAQGQAQAVQYTASKTGTSATVSFYVDSPNTATAGALGIYSDSAGNPRMLLKQVSFVPVTGWNTVTLTGVSITSGTKYWLAELGTHGVLAFRDRGSGAATPGSSQTNLTSLPATWSTGPSWASGLESFYVSG
jgi:hypothetical protein